MESKGVFKYPFQSGEIFSLKKKTKINKLPFIRCFLRKWNNLQTNILLIYAFIQDEEISDLIIV